MKHICLYTNLVYFTFVFKLIMASLLVTVMTVVSTV